MTTLTDTRTLTDRAVAACADRALHAATAMGRPHRLDADLAVAWQGDRGVFTNLAYVLQEPQDWGDLLARVAAAVPAGRPLTLVATGATPDLGALGWHLVGHPPLMVRPAGGTGPVAPAELTVVEVLDEVGLEVFERTLVDAYPDPQLQPYRFGTVHDGRILGGPTHLFTGTVAGRPAATAGGHVAHGVNVVEFVSTMPAARGRGYGAALTWAASVVDPALPAVLFASDLGRPVYEALGYLACSRWTIWHRHA
jgi:GNAT superfamily N-acetyltransferase